MKEKSKRKKIAVVYATAILSVGAFGAQYANEYKEAIKNLNGAPAERMIRNVLLPITLPVGSDAIKVFISENFTDEQKQHIVKSITELDEKFDGLKYDIIMDPEKVDKQVIKINKVYMDNNCGGRISYKMKGYHMAYPIEIKMNSKYDNCGSKVFESVFKHEMLHALGLEDIYDKEYKHKTIMYGYTTVDSLRDLTQEDVDIVNTIYTAKDSQEPVLSVKTSVNKEPFIFFDGELLKYNKQDDEMIM